MTFAAGFLLALLLAWLYDRWRRHNEIVCEWEPEEDE